ncbi:MAG: hypothetical protein KKD74_02145 [Bacteroidetes bacterium]|nr:hypothetical protein [Bacteroidales bacterium]MBU1008913.1 hypothetical protein [Bacteroidota bacterium]
MKLKHQGKKVHKKDKPKLIFGLFSPWSLLGMVAGGVGGLVYYFFIGCNIEGCAIISNPFMSALWGALLALILAEVIRIIAIDDSK